MTRAERLRHRRITRGVRRGKAMENAADARIAVERAARERRGLRAARVAYAGVGVLGAAGVVAGIFGWWGFLVPGWFLFTFGALGVIYMLPRREQYLARAEELNRVVADSADTG